MPTRPPVLIERWFPIDVIGAESMRERGASSALPPLYFLHVWWARRPLLTSRAAILASVLPAWNGEWPEALRDRFPDEKSYERWFVRLCGIFGDPVAGRKLIQWAKDTGFGKLPEPPYKHKRAFTINPTEDFRVTLGDLLEHTWGKRDLSVLDPFSGGGSIPFEAVRYGFDTYANELNPVARIVLDATLEVPNKYGEGLLVDLRKWGQELEQRVRARLTTYYPQRTENIHAFIWARTVRCPYTGKTLPLLPNWWLSKSRPKAALKPIFASSKDEATYEVVLGDNVDALDPDTGTVKRGNGISPWAANQPVDGDYIKAEAQDGRMGQQLCALVLKSGSEFRFSPPSQADLEAVKLAETDLAELLPSLTAKDLVPTEPRTEGRADWSTRIYGMTDWSQTFGPRQLLSMTLIAQEIRDLYAEVTSEVGEDRAGAILKLLAMVFDKALAHNSRQVTWDAGRMKVRNTFVRHDFSFKWSPAEFDAANALIPWSLDQILDAYLGICRLLPGDSGEGSANRITMSQGSAARLATIGDSSIDHICVDPPYYDNVMYAELADYFYVWLKRILRDVYPGMLVEELCNKDDEAVANAARFSDRGKKKKQLALEDYQRKMSAAFSEMQRVLTDDGVLTVMFTHKQVEAWDTLASSLIGAGFAIHSSWPVHTESDKSVHQAKKNAAQSTILLSCRKRTASTNPVWWEDLKGRIRRVAREKAGEFEAQGIRGVDLYIATFGPTLAILSENWPVLTSEVDEQSGEPKPLRPEIALDLAREEVIDLRKQGLLLGRTVAFDPFTDWYLMAWDAFQAQEFPGDEARKLALALGLDLEKQIISEKKLVTKKGATVLLQSPTARRKRGMVDPDLRTFSAWIDAVHTAMLLYQEDGAQACQQFLREAELLNDSTFKALVQALINAIPRTKQKGEFVRPEAATLEKMRLSFFDDLTSPPETDAAPVPQQGDLFDQSLAAPQALNDGKDLHQDEEDGS